jgi:glycopeptide antibiotics resistance protein
VPSRLTSEQPYPFSFALADPILRHLVPIDGVEVPVSETSSPPDTGARLAAALLAYVVLITAIITLLPFEFAMPARPRVILLGDAMDVLANVALFVPFGFLYAVARHDLGVRPMRVLGVALLVSGAIESIQLFEVSRFASLSDVIANGFGAYVGALAQRTLAKRIAVDAKTVGRLALELPVMGIVYLLVPLLWVDGIAGVGAATPLWPLLALGLFGASLLAAVQRHHFGPNRLLSRELMVVAACGWFLVGGFPGLAPRASIVFFVMLAAIGAFVWVRSADKSGARPINRRFESRVLWEASPFYGAYLLLLVAPVSGYSSTRWRGSFGFDVAAGDWTATAVLHIVEVVAAFTLFGYMLAELRGRREARFREGAKYIAGWAAAAGFVAELLEGLRPDGSASLLRGVMLVAAALYGAYLYHLQRAHVRRLLGRS